MTSLRCGTLSHELVIEHGTARWFLMRYLSFLRYFLIWPVVGLVRDRARRRLAWRLSVSHLSTVLASLVALFLLIWAVAVVVTLVFDPAGAEPATDAEAVARVLTGDMAMAPSGVATNQDALAPLLGSHAGSSRSTERSGWCRWTSTPPSVWNMSVRSR
jgi:hypothetical protein